MQRYEEALHEVRKLDITSEQKEVIFKLLRDAYRTIHDMKICATCTSFMVQDEPLEIGCGHKDGLLLPTIYSKCKHWELFNSGE